MQIPFQINHETIYLTAGEGSYSLSRQRERTRDGVITTELEPFKWFANIGTALNRIIDMKVQSSDAKSMLELKQIIESARKEVMAAWKTQA